MTDAAALPLDYKKGTDAEQVSGQFNSIEEHEKKFGNLSITTALMQP